MNELDTLQAEGKLTEFDWDKVLLTPLACCHAFDMSVDVLRQARKRDQDKDVGNVGYVLRVSDKPVYLARLAWAMEKWPGRLIPDRLQGMATGAATVGMHAVEKDGRARVFEAIIVHRSPVFELRAGMPANIASAYNYAGNIGEGSEQK